MRIKILVVFIIIFFGFIAYECAASKLPEGVYKGLLKEKIDASGYSYLKVNEGGRVYWIAVPQIVAKINETLYFSKGIKMVNFTSKTMNRTFDTILFVENISLNQPGDDKPEAHPKVGNKPLKKVKIIPLSDGITVAKAYANKKSLSGKTIKIKGQVIKFNSGILNRNWIHIQDGTKNGSNFDLLVTSDEIADIGEVIIVTGTLVLDKDFGSGYKYSVLVEKATISREK